MKSSKFTGKINKIKAKWTQVSLRNILKVKDPKLSMVLIVQNNLYASDKFAKRATYEFFSALFLLLVGSGPKKSMAIEKLGSSSLVSFIFQREGKPHCSLTGQKLWSQAKKKCSRHLIYARACVNKYWAKRLIRTYIRQAGTLCYKRLWFDIFPGSNYACKCSGRFLKWPSTIGIQLELQLRYL